MSLVFYLYLKDSCKTLVIFPFTIGCPDDGHIWLKQARCHDYILIKKLDAPDGTSELTYCA
jgi:hypothetical protein